MFQLIGKSLALLWSGSWFGYLGRLLEALPKVVTMNFVNLSDCENEPLRFPGTVMPHGALVVLQAGPSSPVAAASDSCAALLGLSPEDMLGASFGELFGADAAAALTIAQGDELRPILRLSRHGRNLLARAGINEAGQMLVDIEPSSQDACGLDLGRSSLRSVSPVHIEYLKNMGVRATLVGALVVEGKLWGLLACHHVSGPKYFGPDVMEMLEWLCQDIAALIEVTLIRQRQARVHSLALRRQALAEMVRAGDARSLMGPASVFPSARKSLSGMAGGFGFQSKIGEGSSFFITFPVLSQKGDANA